MAIAVPKHTQTPNELFDEWLPEMSNTELRVTLVVIRKTLGWHKPQDEISLTQFQKLTGLSRNGVISGIDAAIKRGTIKEAGTGARGVKLYAPVYGGCESGALSEPDDGQNKVEVEPCQMMTSALSEPVEVTTSAASELDKASTSALSEPTKETTTKESKELKKKDSTALRATHDFTIESQYGVGVGEDWLLAYWKQAGKKPVKAAKPRKRDLVFDAISAHVFGIADTTLLNKTTAGRVGGMAKDCREAFEKAMGTNEDVVLAEAIGAHAKYCKDNDYKAPEGRDNYNTKFVAYLLLRKDIITKRLHTYRNPKPVEVDDSPLIGETEAADVVAAIAALAAEKSANTKRPAA